MENIKKWAIVLLLVNMAVVIYYGQSIKKELRAVKDEQTSNYHNLSNQIITQGNNISSSMEYFIRENNNLIADYKHRIVNTDLTSKSGDIEYELVIKESSSNSKIIGEFKELDSNNSYRAEFEHTEGLTYRSKTTLALDKNYEVHIYEQMNDGATKKLNTSEIYLLLYNEVYADRIQGLGSGTVTSDDRITYEHSFKFTGDIIEGANIDKVILQVIDSQQNIFNEYDITNQVSTKTIHNAELEDKYKVALASGQLEYEMTFDKYVAQYGSELEEKGHPYILYNAEKSFTKDELNEDWEMIRDGRYYFTLKVIFEDGIEVQL